MCVCIVYLFNLLITVDNSSQLLCSYNTRSEVLILSPSCFEIVSSTLLLIEESEVMTYDRDNTEFRSISKLFKLYSAPDRQLSLFDLLQAFSS